jgi:hypothetical protein
MEKFCLFELLLANVVPEKSRTISKSIFEEVGLVQHSYPYRKGSNLAENAGIGLLVSWARARWERRLSILR